jgi:hypothetical protein
MGKLAEYIKLIPKGIKNLPQIIEGLTNQIKLEHGTLPEEDVEVIVGRRLICASCPFLSTNATKAGVYASSRNDVHCTMCGCPIEAKTASLESDCGIDDYNKKFPNRPLQLKWTKVK